MDEEDIPDPRIWWDSTRKAYRTDFPPPEGSDCQEHEQFGHRDYDRSLTDAEAATMTARDDAVAAKRRATDEAERDAFFASADEEAEEARPPSANTDNAPKGKGAKKMTPDVKSSPGA